MRIASLLPSATEIVCELGLEASLVGVSHECDFPPSVRSLPILTRSILAAGLSSREVDDQVSAALGEGRSLYSLDEERLEALRPDVVITQELCDVCAVNHESVARVLAGLPTRPSLVSLSPGCIEDIFADVASVGRATGAAEAARRLVDEARRRLESLSRLTEHASRLRVLALEWTDPPFTAGHWVPEQVRFAGGEDVFGRPREPSRRISWAEISAADPDVVVVMPCGYDLAGTRTLVGQITAPEWTELRAVREGRVHAVDANAFFSRPALRVVEGAWILGRILHPDRVNGS